jgi:hypothetical protein
MKRREFVKGLVGMAMFSEIAEWSDAAMQLQSAPTSFGSHART